MGLSHRLLSANVREQDTIGVLRLFSEGLNLVRSFVSHTKTYWPCREKLAVFPDLPLLWSRHTTKRILRKQNEVPTILGQPLWSLKIPPIQNSSKLVPEKGFPVLEAVRSTVIQKTFTPKSAPSIIQHACEKRGGESKHKCSTGKKTSGSCRVME